jgi:hypothetical protein
MGWDGVMFNENMTKSKALKFLKREFEDTIIDMEAVPCRVVRDDPRYEVYTAMKDIETGEIYGCVILLDWRKVGTETELLYKSMSESLGPYAYSCPEHILNRLSPTNAEWALKWRSECRKTIKNKVMGT